MTVDEAIQQLQKLSNEGKGHFLLLALDDQKYSIVMPVKKFIECGEDPTGEIPCDSIFVNTFSMYE